MASKNMVSPIGEALYPRINKPETYDGKEIGFSIQVKFSEEDTQKLIAQNKALFEEARLTGNLKDKRFKPNQEPNLGFRETDDGDIIFKFKTKHKFIDKKTGQEIDKVIPVFDTHNNPINVNIGNGSLVRIAYTAMPYHVSSTNFGLTLYLNAIQVVKLIEYAGNNFGFPVDDDAYHFETV